MSIPSHTTEMVGWDKYCVSSFSHNRFHVKICNRKGLVQQVHCAFRSLTTDIMSKLTTERVGCNKYCGLPISHNRFPVKINKRKGWVEQVL